LRKPDFSRIQRDRLKTLRANPGCRYNQSRLHCPVAAYPNRTEHMDGVTIETLDLNRPEAADRSRLWEDYDLRFNCLDTLTNMPIQRFGGTLVSMGQFDA
jgi:hypothetical protein